MALNVASQIVDGDIGDGSAVDVAGWNKSLGNEIAKPLGSKGIVFIVI
jgi:hypothetical protein